MTDEELKKHHIAVEQKLDKISKDLHSKTRALLTGILSGFGYILGIVAALVIVGYVLNVIGVIPAFREQAGEWRNLLQQAASQKIPGAK